jgi:hypothetical protein
MTIDMRGSLNSDFLGLFVNGRYFARSKDGVNWKLMPQKDIGHINLMGDLTAFGFLPLNLPPSLEFKFQRHLHMCKCGDCGGLFLNECEDVDQCDPCYIAECGKTAFETDRFYDPTGGTAPEGLDWKGEESDV